MHGQTSSAHISDELIACENTHRLVGEIVEEVGCCKTSVYKWAYNGCIIPDARSAWEAARRHFVFSVFSYNYRGNSALHGRGCATRAPFGRGALWVADVLSAGVHNPGPQQAASVTPHK